MIGRNHPDSATVLGIQPPHLTSNDLVKMVLDANNEGPKFKLDTLWDKVEHPEYWFFQKRSFALCKVGYSFTHVHNAPACGLSYTKG